jgi:hypothetical protein
LSLSFPVLSITQPPLGSLATVGAKVMYVMEEGFVEVDMNAGDEPAAFPTVRATVVQASSVFFDTPATIGTCQLKLSLYRNVTSVALCQ